MSYYGVSVLITILVTSLVAFYLLYKAKELNLGIVISIASGSIILGFTFYPAFKAVMKLLSDNININKILALIISLLSVLTVFLLFILIISFIISICIPKKLASVDCCIVIDRIISKITIKDGIISIKEKSTVFFRKIVSNIQEIVRNVYKLINKLKKPVDTKQIIDTMGIEKNENGIFIEKGNNIIETPEAVAFANLIAFMEPSREVACANQDSFTGSNNIDQAIESKDSAYENLAAAAYQEMVTTHLSDTPTDEVAESEIEEINVLESELPENELVEINAVENELPENEIVQINTIEIEVPEIEVVQINTVEIEVPEREIVEVNAVESETPKSEIVHIDVVGCEVPQIETKEAEPIQSLPSDEDDVDSLVLKAFESKDAGRKEDAIECYIEALHHEPNNEMIFWIVLDICALYKQLGLHELAKNILEGLVSEYAAAIQPEVKMEIMNYLK